MDLDVKAMTRIVPEDILKDTYPKLDRLTNGDVRELVALASSIHNHGDKLAFWVKSIFIFNDWEWPSDCKMLSVRAAAARVRRKAKTFKKLEEKKKFLSCTFKIPIPIRKIKRKVEEEEKCEVRVKRAHAEKIISKIKYQPKYVNYRLKVKNNQIKELREQVASLQKERIEIQCLQEENAELKKKLKRVSSNNRVTKLRWRKFKANHKNEQFLMKSPKTYEISSSCGAVSD